MRFYKSAPIASVGALAKALHCSKEDLVKCAMYADRMYRIVSKEVKSDGGVKTTYDAHVPLKAIQKSMHDHIFGKVDFPSYLYGGLKERDYISDAAEHTRSRVVITEDVSRFFESISSGEVMRMWLRGFCFPPSIAELLTKLTTHDGHVPRGAATSGDIANVVLLHVEASLVEQFRRRGLRYTRFVDDVTVSSDRKVSNQEISWIISRIYSVMGRIGVRANRAKHRIARSGTPMVVHGLVVNSKAPTVGMSSKRRISAQVHRLEERAMSERGDLDYGSEWRSIQGRIANYARMHERAGRALHNRLNDIKPK